MVKSIDIYQEYGSLENFKRSVLNGLEYSKELSVVLSSISINESTKFKVYLVRDDDGLAESFYDRYNNIIYIIMGDIV